MKERERLRQREREGRKKGSGGRKIPEAGRQSIGSIFIKLLIKENIKEITLR